MKASTVILVPVYNDWKSVSRLVQLLEQEMPEEDCQILLINDGSTDPAETIGSRWPLQVLHLTVNLGHQKAIASGLSYIHHRLSCNHILIMDADGEDRPSDAAKLLSAARSNPNNIVVGRRKKRQEGFLFQLAYRTYKFLFRVMTGKKISFGHFMVIPASFADRLVYQSDIWNNLAATVLKSRLPTLAVNTEKAPRLDGQSKMSFHSLLMHGLGAIAVFIETIAIRLFNISLLIMGISALVILFILSIKWFTDLAIPGWASIILSTIIIVLLQGFLLSLFTIFLYLSSQSQRKFIPARHYTDYLTDDNQKG